MRTPIRPLAASLARFTHAAAVCAALSLATAARAADLTWDPDGIVDANFGGDGIWDLEIDTPAWFNGTTHVPWNNTQNDTAIFGGIATGVPRVVTLDSEADPTLSDVSIVAGGLSFLSDGYRIDDLGFDTVNGVAAGLTLAGTSPTISVLNATDSAEITAILRGTAGLTKAGAGRLVLTAANTFTGDVNVNNGTLVLTGQANNLGTPQLGGATTINLAGGTTLSISATENLRVNPADPATRRVINIAPGGATINSDVGALRLVDNDQLVGSGTLTRTGGATTYGLDIRGSNPGFTGNVVVQTGTLELQNVNAIGDGSNAAQIVTVKPGAILSTTVATRQNIVLDGGTIAFNNNDTSSYTGSITINAPSEVLLKDFYAATGRGGRLTGALIGSSDLTIRGGNVPKVLAVTGNTSQFTGNYTIADNAVLSLTTGLRGGTGNLGNQAISLSDGVLRVAGAMGSQAGDVSTGSGLLGRYYNQGVAGTANIHNNQTLEVIYTSPDATRIDANVSFPSMSAVANLGTASGVPGNIGVTNGTNRENWAAMWTGLINITNPGDYLFVSSSDDATAVFIDGQQVVTNEGGHGFPGGGHRGTPISLTSGQHSIVVKLTQGTGGGGILLAYEGPDQPVPVQNPLPQNGFNAQTIVPASVLRQGAFTGTISNQINVAAGRYGGLDASGMFLRSTGPVSLGEGSTFNLGSVTIHGVNQVGTVTVNGDFVVSTQLGTANNTKGTAADSEISGNIVRSGTAPAVVNMTKDGFGTLTLSGTNNFGGSITVVKGNVAGTAATLNNDLLLNDQTKAIFNQNAAGTYGKAISSQTPGGIVEKNGVGDLTLTQNLGANLVVNGGKAITPAGITGDASVRTGGSLESPGAISGLLNLAGGSFFGPANATVSVGSLSIGSGSTLNLNLAAGNLGARIDSAGPLSLTGASLINLAGTALTAGSYRIVDYVGDALTPAQFGQVSVGTRPSGSYGVLTNNTAATSVDFVVENFGATNTWVGATGVWDSATPANWNSGAFADGQQVVFNDSGTTKVISSTGVVSPQTITFNNSAGNDYTIANAIGGNVAGGIQKSGTGSATMSGQISAAGDITVSGGTLRLTNTANATANAISGLAKVTGGATLDVAFGGVRTGTATPGGTSALGSANLDLSGGTVLFSGKDYSPAAGGLTIYTYAQQVQRNARTEFQTLPGINALFNTSTPEVLTGGLLDAIGVINNGNNSATAPFATIGLAAATDNVMATWKGQFIATADQAYTFTGRSDDGLMLFIDGQLVVSRNNFQGATNTTNTINLTQGRHDIFAAYYEGGSNAIAQLFSDAVGTQLYTESSFAAAQPYTVLSNNVRWNASSTIAADNTYGVTLGNLGANTAGTTLTAGRIRVTGQPSADGLIRFNDTDFNASGTFTIDAKSDVALGTVRDGTNTITLVKTGSGNLILDSAGTVDTNGTTIQVQEGRLVAARSGTGNPLGTAAIQLNGEGTVLQFNRAEPLTTNSTFANSIQVNANARIESMRHRTADGGDVFVGGPALPLPIAGGKTLELHATPGANLQIDSPISGLGSNLRIVNPADPGNGQAVVMLRQPNTFTGNIIIDNGGHLRIDNADALKTQSFVDVAANGRIEFFVANSYTAATPRILSKAGSFFRVNNASALSSGVLEVGPGRVLEIQTGAALTGGATVLRAPGAPLALNTNNNFLPGTTQVGFRPGDMRPLDTVRMVATINGAGFGTTDSGWGATPQGTVIQIFGGNRNISNVNPQMLNGQVVTIDGASRNMDNGAGLIVGPLGGTLAGSGGFALVVLDEITMTVDGTETGSGKLTIGANIPLDSRFSGGTVALASGSGLSSFTGTATSAATAVDVIAGSVLEGRAETDGDTGFGLERNDALSAVPTLGVNLARGTLRSQPAGTTTAGVYRASVAKVFATGAGTMNVNRNSTTAGVEAELRLDSSIVRSPGATVGLLSSGNVLGGIERIRFNRNADAPQRLTIGGNPVNMVSPYLVNASGNFGNFVDYDPAQNSLTGPGFTNVTYASAADEASIVPGSILQTTADIDLAGNVSVAAARLDGNLTGTGTLTTESGGLIITTATNVNRVISAPITAGAGQELIVYSGGGTGGLHTLNSTITSNAGFTKFGPRTLELLGNNRATLVGDVTVNEGSLTINSDDNLGAVANKVVLNGGNLRPAANLTVPRQIVVNAGGGQLTNDGNRTVEFSGEISGPGALTINSVTGNTGVNRLTAAANTFESGLIISNGVVEFSKNEQLGALPLATDYDRGHVVLNDGATTTNVTLRLATGSGAVSTGDRAFTVLGAAPRFSATDSADRLTIPGIIRGSGGLNKDGLGTLSLTSPIGNGYTGVTNVNAGTLLVNNTSLSATGSGAVNVKGSATFAGAGKIDGPIIVEGLATLAPGLSAGASGRMQGQSGLNLQDSSVFSWSLGTLSTANPGTDFDQVVLDAGALTIGTGVEFDVTFALGVAPSQTNPFWTSNQVWSDVIDLTGLATLGTVGSFTIDNSAWATFGSFQTVVDTTGVDLVWTAVPEPTSAVTLLMGLGSLLGLQRFRRPRA